MKQVPSALAVRLIARFWPLLLMVACCLPGCVKKPTPEVVPEAVTSTGRILMPRWLGEIAVPLADANSPLGSALDIPTRVLAETGEPGGGVRIMLVLEGNQEKATAPAMLRAAMATAIAVQRSYASRQPVARVRVDVYPALFSPSLHTITLATLLFVPGNGGPDTWVFPGPAWQDVRAAARGLSDKELRYLDMIQRLTPVRNATEGKVLDAHTDVTLETARKAFEAAGLKASDLALNDLRLQPYK